MEIINPEQILATLSKEGRLSMNMTAEWGKGYVPAELHKTEDDPIGTLALDAVFSPVRKVSYKITNARVGRRTDYDKLTIEIWTSGAVHPEDALAQAAKILREQFLVFLNFEEEEKAVHVEKPQREPEINENLYRSVESWNLAFGPPIALRTLTSNSLASWFSAPKPKCSRLRISAENRSTKSKRFWPTWTSS